MTDEQEAGHPYAMIVSCIVRPGQLDAVLGRFEEAMPRIRSEDGCLGFQVFVEHASDALWVYEQWVTKAYHDDVHESFPEIQALLADLPPHLDGGWTVHGLRQVLER